MEEYLTVPDAASKLHIHPETLRQWIRQGRIRSHKPGKLYYIPLSAIREYIEGSPVSIGADQAPIEPKS